MIFHLWRSESLKKRACERCSAAASVGFLWGNDHERPPQCVCAECAEPWAALQALSR